MSGLASRTPAWEWLALAAAAFHVSKRPAGGSLTYGYQRFQILAAFVNGLSLLLIVGWILYEAVSRFLSPQEVMGQTMLIVASLGLLVNIVAFAVLHGGDRENLNIRGAALHVAGDLLGSVAAIVAAIGLLENNLAVIVGAMVIAPLLTPNVAFALATTLGDTKLARKAIKTLAALLLPPPRPAIRRIDWRPACARRARATSWSSFPTSRTASTARSSAVTGTRACPCRHSARPRATGCTP